MGEFLHDVFYRIYAVIHEYLTDESLMELTFWDYVLTVISIYAIFFLGCGIYIAIKVLTNVLRAHKFQIGDWFLRHRKKR